MLTQEELIVTDVILVGLIVPPGASLMASITVIDPRAYLQPEPPIFRKI